MIFENKKDLKRYSLIGIAVILAIIILTIILVISSRSSKGNASLEMTATQSALTNSIHHSSNSGLIIIRRKTTQTTTPSTTTIKAKKKFPQQINCGIAKPIDNIELNKRYDMKKYYPHWPWSVQIKEKNRNKYSYSGTLIAIDLVLVAKNQIRLNKADRGVYVVAIGNLTFNIAEFIFPPESDDISFKDMALIKLESAILSRDIVHACLPDFNIDLKNCNDTYLQHL